MKPSIDAELLFQASDSFDAYFSDRPYDVFVRDYWRRPGDSHGFGEKTEHVVEHVRRHPLG